MTSPRFQTIALVLAILMLAAACGGSEGASSASTTADDDSTTANEESATGETGTDDPGAAADGDTPTDTDGDAGDGTGDDAGDGTSETAAGDSSAETSTLDQDGAAATDPADADPSTLVTTMVRALFNVEPTPEAVACILAEADERPLLAQAIEENRPIFSQYGEDMLNDVTRGINGCVDPVALGGWATEAVGPTGEVRLTAPACFGDAFSDPNDGDDLFQTFIALSFQYRYEPAMLPGIVDTLSTCTPAWSLAEFFAAQHEQSNGFAVDVDRDCLVDVLTPREASETFWTTFIDGAVPPPTVIEPYLVECETEPSAGFDDAVPADFQPWSGSGALSAVLPAARLGIYTSPPPMSIDPAGTYTAVFATGGGEIRIRLFADTAPITVNNFVSLARDGYYDGTVFHRVLDGFMAQGGDPTGTGTGGPGYSFEDEVDGGPALDKPGLLAMANSGPNTNGSQFFITFVPTEWLTGNHTVFGEVIEGIEIVNAIERRDPAAPGSRGQVLETVTIIEG